MLKTWRMRKYIYSFTQWSISTENELQLYVPPEVKFRNNILLLKPKSQTLTKLRHHFMAWNQNIFRRSYTRQTSPHAHTRASIAPKRPRWVFSLSACGLLNFSEISWSKQLHLFLASLLWSPKDPGSEPTRWRFTPHTNYADIHCLSVPFLSHSVRPPTQLHSC